MNQPNTLQPASDSSWAAYSEEELVLKAQQGDDAAFAELMRRTSSTSFRLALSILRDRQEAEDEVQNSYWKAWRHIAQFQRESKFTTWLSRIVVNQCLMQLRKLRATPVLHFEDLVNPDGSMRAAESADERATAEAELGGREVAALVRKEIHRLPPLLREVVVLRDMDQLSTEEVANRLHISPGAVKSRLLRARAELRNRLEKYCGRAGHATLTA